ncbi:DUF1289 domain-containing protein [Balneatrix alpica]|uniref:DUF1289 domain-containing protein n=1 Tax=Balneatrix alpica TaxID=75684 RepID=A0ABV5Z7T7_9GAMM|nr:DUF1289 domain-containing protein [Balneatrix alpica]
MSQLDLFDIPVPSPCAGVCESDNRGFCRGCLRTRDERFHWHQFSNQQRLQVIQACRMRYLRRLQAQRQQQRGQVSDTPQPQLPLDES